jgi:hypothetical protein
MYRAIAVVLTILMLAFTACIDEAPTVQPPPDGDEGEQYKTGDSLLHVEGIYPRDPNPLLLIFADAPVDTDLVILFSKPVNIDTITSSNVQIESSPTGTINFNNSHVTSFADNKGIRIDLTAAYGLNLPYETAFSVTLNKDKELGILADDPDTETNYLYQDDEDEYKYQFTTGKDTSADLDPVVIKVTRYPADLATDVSRELHYVEVTFSKDMDVMTITPASFQVIDNSVPANITTSITNVDNRTFHANLPPLTYNQNYTVNLTADITDDPIYGSNPLVLDGYETWSFTTETQQIYGAQGIGSVWVTDITDTQATVYFTTNNPVATNLCSVDFGNSTAYGSNQAGVSASIEIVHLITITLPTHATKYWYQINVPTLAPQNTDPATGNTLAFITEDDGSSNSMVSTNASDKSDLVVLQHNNRFIFNGSSFAVWKDGTDYDIYGQYFDTDGSIGWSASGMKIDTLDRSNIRIFTDFLGYAIVTLEEGGTIYAKRIYHTGATLGFDSNWAANPAADGVIIGSGTNPVAVFIWGAQGNNNVYDGFVTKLYPDPGTTSPRTTDMGYLSWSPGDYFFDFSQNIGSPASDSILYRISDHQVSTVTNTSDYNRVRRQASNNFITAGDQYIIADAGITSSFTARNHTRRTGGSVTNGGDDIYTTHGYSPSGVDVGDIIDNGSKYGMIEGISSINWANQTYSGTERTLNRLIDVSKDFSSTGLNVQTTDDVLDDSGSTGDVVAVFKKELSVAGGTFNWDDSYWVYDETPVESGDASSSTVGELVDSGAGKNFASTVKPGDIVVNRETLNYTFAKATITVDTIPLQDGGFVFNSGDRYYVYQVVTSGTINRDYHVVYDNTTLWTGVAANDLVRCVSPVGRARVVQNFSNRILELTDNIFTDSSNREYRIYNDYCTAHNDERAFYYIDVDNNSMNTSSGNTCEIHDALINGTADAPPTNPLFDNGVNFSTYSVGVGDIVIHENNMTWTYINNTDYYTYGALGLAADIGIVDDQQYWILGGDPVIGTNLLEWGDISSVAVNVLNDSANYQATFVAQGVAKGDIVYNINRDSYAVVVTVTSQTQLQLNKDAAAMGWTAGDIYMVFRSDEPIIEMGTVTIAGNPFTDSSANFSDVQVGDIVHNNDSGDDAYVIAIAGQQLTLNADIMSSGDRYVIMQPRILFVYERGGNIYGKVIRLRDGSDYQGLGEIDICTAMGTQQNVHVVERGFRGSFNGGAFVVYESGGTICAKLVDGDGVVPSGTGLGTSIGSGTIIDVISESRDMFYILSRNGTTIKLSSISNALTENWSKTYTVEDAAMMITPSYFITIAYSGDSTLSEESKIFIEQFDSAGTNQYAKSDVVTLIPYAYCSNLSITASPSTDGAIISWIDDRYFATLGFTVMAQAVDAAGIRLWNADPAGSDYDGILIGIPGTWETADIDLKALFYNDAASPWGGLFIWYDYRNNRSDIFYDTRSN